MKKNKFAEPLRVEEIQFGSPAYDEVTALREEELFGRFEAELELKGLREEYSERHFGLYDAEDRLLAAGSVRKKDTKEGENAAILQIYQVVVQKKSQKKGLGTRLMAYLETLARRESYQQAYLEVPEAVVPFFESIGYKKYGRSFKLQGVKHYRMKKELLFNKG